MSGIEPTGWTEPDSMVYVCEYCLIHIHEDDVPVHGDILCADCQPRVVAP